jgi:hypothetical protein
MAEIDEDMVRGSGAGFKAESGGMGQEIENEEKIKSKEEIVVKKERNC